MPRGIEQSDWDIIHQTACDITNASMVDDSILVESHTQRMFENLNNLRIKYGDHPSLIATTADYLESHDERRNYYSKALRIAEKMNYTEEIKEISDSLSNLERENKG